MNGLDRYLAPIKGRVALMLNRAVIKLVDNAKKSQELQLQLLDGETQDAVERYGDYGFTSHPLPGAECIAASIGGLRSNMVVIAVEDRRYRLTSLKPGEVALYDDLGQMVLLGRDGIVIESAQKVTVNAPLVELAGDNGAAVARVGDDVDLNTGKILSGSSKVKAA